MTGKNNSILRDQMNIHMERPNACRLYSALGQALWLQSIASSDLPDSKKLEALQVWASNTQSEIGLARLSQMQDEVYCALAVKDQHIQEQTTALRGSN
jgi:hypothetical protein